MESLLRTHFLLFLFLMSISSAALTFEAPKKVKALEKKINSLSNFDLSCEKTDDCIALQVGFKACGGPQRYVVTSKRNSKIEELKQIIESHLKADREWKTKENIGSICNWTSPPSMACEQKQCVTPRQSNVFKR